MNKARFLCLLSVALLSAAAPGDDLYTTDFEAFPVGDNLWAGTEGWISNDSTSGAQGILEDYIDPNQLPLGKTAYLGFERPATAFTTVARPVNYDPATGGDPCVEFESFLGVQDSTNGRRDQFFISFYGIEGDFLAAVVFDNTGASPEMLRWRGVADGSVQVSETGVPFLRGDQVFGFVSVQILFVRVDLAANTWTAQLDGIPLFTNAPFTDPALAPLTLGSVAAEWELDNPNPNFAGDNWLFVADWFVRSVSKSGGPPVIESITRNSSGETTIAWQAQPGFDYHVRYSADLVTWQDNLPNSTFSNVAQTVTLSFTDSEHASNRFYQIRRTVTP